MFVRKAGLPLVEEWNAVLDRDEKIWDQNAFNDLFRKGAGEALPNRLFKAYNVRHITWHISHILNAFQGKTRNGHPSRRVICQRTHVLRATYG